MPRTCLLTSRVHRHGRVGYSLIPYFLSDWADGSMSASWFDPIITSDVKRSFRHYIGIFREETLLDRLSSLLSSVKTLDFEVLSLEPHQKDGGVFVRFKYDARDSLSALETIRKSVRETAAKHGGFPSWIKLARGDVWLVRGMPWREVRLILCHHIPSALTLFYRIWTGFHPRLSNSRLKVLTCMKNPRMISSASVKNKFVSSNHIY